MPDRPLIEEMADLIRRAAYQPGTTLPRFVKFDGDHWGDEARALLARHDASTEQSPWRPIETAPKDGTDILAVWVGGGFEEGYGPEIVAWDVERKLWVNESGEDYMPPTHWTPIPSLPVPDTPTEKE